MPLVQALSAANMDRRHKKTIVVLGEKEKEEMDTELLESIPVKSRSGTKVGTVSKHSRPDIFAWVN